jgi:hypothetical protein
LIGDSAKWAAKELEGEPDARANAECKMKSAKWAAGELEGGTDGRANAECKMKSAK